MTYHAPIGSVREALTYTSRSTLPPLSGSLAKLRTALADKRASVARLEGDWVAAAERELAKHLPKHIRLDDRATWDGPTYGRYLMEAERVEPDFKPAIKRLLAEVDALERLLSPVGTTTRRVA